MVQSWPTVWGFVDGAGGEGREDRGQSEGYAEGEGRREGQRERLEREKAPGDKERQTERGWEVGEELLPRGITPGVSLHWSF